MPSTSRSSRPFCMEEYGTCFQVATCTHLLPVGTTALSFMRAAHEQAHWNYSHCGNGAGEQEQHRCGHERVSVNLLRQSMAESAVISLIGVRCSGIFECLPMAQRDDVRAWAPRSRVLRTARQNRHPQRGLWTFVICMHILRSVEMRVSGPKSEICLAVS